MSRRRYIAFASFTVAASLVIALLFSELVFRILGLGYAHSPVVSDPYLHHSHPGNLSFVSHHWTNEFGGHRIRYAGDGRVVNPDGERRNLSAENRVAFMGDSFVEALQVPWSHSFVGLLDFTACDDTEVRNYGVSSYSPILYPIQWERQVSEFAPTLILLMLYSNDVTDDESYLVDSELDGSGRVIAVPGPKQSRIRLLLRRSYFLRFIRKQYLRVSWLLKYAGNHDDVSAGLFFEENRDIVPKTTEFLLRLRDQTRLADSHLVLTAVPSRNQAQNSGDGEFADKVKQWALQFGVDYIDLKQAFHERIRNNEELFFDNDIHFNQQGHQLVAEVIRRAYPALFQCKENSEQVALH